MDMCAGGAGLCLYATCCTPCAAGEVAVAADRSYAMACCVAPLLGHLAHSDALRDLIEACFWMVRGAAAHEFVRARRCLVFPLPRSPATRAHPLQGDRRALVQKYGVDDSELNQPCQLPSAFCLMTCCPQCLLVQVSWPQAGRQQTQRPNDACGAHRKSTPSPPLFSTGAAPHSQRRRGHGAGPARLCQGCARPRAAEHELRRSARRGASFFFLCVCVGVV